jgi:two-component system phosphate regulon sensor histidine kinase PhoR
MKYVAVPVRGPARNKVVAVVRASVPLTFVEKALATAYWQIALGCLAAAVLFALLGLAISKRISQPLEELRAGAEDFARGRLSRRLPEEGLAEISALARSMNQMAGQLDERIRSTTRERNEREAILASMVEGVLAVDRAGKVMGLNRACSRLLHIDPAGVQGRDLSEVVRNAELQAFAERALRSPGPIEGDVVIRADDGQDSVLQAHGALLRDASGREIGAVVVLNDVTRLRRLESIRRDFVANVSHELRTPITSIRGAVETLEDGALADAAERDRFMGMISRQSDRLGAIIEDLLSLSRIEQEEESAGIALETAPLEPVLSAAVQACAARAAEREVRVQVSCPQDLRGRINPPLLENAVVNLVDNAVKYSSPGGEVGVEAVRADAGIRVAVIDRGCGIERKHLPRIFERFYRVDKARSRKLGGTGLGLAIVKHIAGAHGGGVAVESTPGQGSTFTICLPA